MSRFWNPALAKLAPYVPGEQPRLSKLIKLNTNENPFGPSPHVVKALQAAANDSLRLYPDPHSHALAQAIGAYHGVDTSEVFIGNGSDEVLAHVFLGLLKHERPVLFPDITYSFYPVYCGLYDMAYHEVPVSAGMEIRVEDYAQPCGGIILPNPNAPTGIGLASAQIEALLVSQPDVVVVVDEAYVDFGGESVVPLVARYPNLLVVRTLSKSRSLAGLRVGYAIGHQDLIVGLERVKNCFNSYPIDRLAQAGALASFEDEAYFQHTRQEVMRLRAGLVASLEQRGFEVLPSQANFIFARHPRHDAAQLAARLRERSVIVRHFRHPRIDQFLRISVGKEEECAALVTALTDIVGPAGA